MTNIAFRMFSWRPAQANCACFGPRLGKYDVLADVTSQVICRDNEKSFGFSVGIVCVSPLLGSAWRPWSQISRSFAG